MFCRKIAARVGVSATRARPALAAVSMPRAFGSAATAAPAATASLAAVMAAAAAAATAAMVHEKQGAALAAVGQAPSAADFELLALTPLDGR